MRTRHSVACLVLLVVCAPAFAIQLNHMETPSGDAARDQEPVVITKTVDGTVETVAAWMKFDAQSHPRIWVASENHGGQQQLPLAPGMHSSGDPAIAANPYTDYGLLWNRIYVVGTMFSDTLTQIAMWYTDDGGATWLGPFNVTSVESRSLYFYDKPSLDVSAYYIGAGEPYVATMRLRCDAACVAQNFQTATQEIHVYRSTNGTTFTPTWSVTSLDRFNHAPQIIVDAWYGGIHLFNLQWNENGITHGVLYLRRSFNNGASFDGPQALDAGILNGPNNDALCCLVPAYLGARSMLVARFNRSTGSIGLVWHAREENGGEHLDVKFASYNTVRSGWGVWPPVNVGHAAPGVDQWNPAIDYDDTPARNWLISYYDRRNDASNALIYNVFMTRVTGLGAPVDTWDQWVTTASSDPKYGPLQNQAYPLGEYQGIAYMGGPGRLYTCIYTYVLNGQPDVYWFRTQSGF